MRLHLWAKHPSTTDYGEDAGLWYPSRRCSSGNTWPWTDVEPSDDCENNSFFKPSPDESFEDLVSNQVCLYISRSADSADDDGKSETTLPTEHTDQELTDRDDSIRNLCLQWSSSVLTQTSKIVVKLIYFLQGDPFYRVKQDGTFVWLPRLNHDKEFDMVMDAIQGKNVQMVARKLTFKALSDVFSKSDCNILHWAAHGFESYLGVEDHDELGKMNLVYSEQLKERVQQEAPNLDIVIVSACRTEIIGNALIEAGVKFVICVRHRSDIGDEAAISFSHCFYKYLVSEKEDLHVQQAFDLAVLDVEMKHGKQEAEKFMLLRANQQQRTMKIELAHPQTAETPMPILYGQKAPEQFPRLPEIPVGRENDVRLLINAIFNNRLICVSGPPDVGKAEVVTIACHYLWERLYFKGLRLNSIRWFVYKHLKPPMAETCPITKVVFGFIRDRTVTEKSFITMLRVKRQEISDALFQKTDLLVFEAKELDTQHEAKKMAIFVQTLLCNTDGTKVIVIHEDGVDMNQCRIWSHRENIRIGPMTMEESLRLFKECLSTEFIDEKYHGMITPKEFCCWLYDHRMESWLIRDTERQPCSLTIVSTWFRKKWTESFMPTVAVNNSHKLRRLARRLYDKIGSGKAKDVRSAAFQMNAVDHDELVSIRQKINDLMYDYVARTEILKKSRRFAAALENARRTKDYVACAKAQKKIDLLNELTHNFPQLHESIVLKRQTELGWAKAHHFQHWNLAKRLESTRVQLERLVDVQITEEEVSIGATCPDCTQIKTRFQLERTISAKNWMRDDAYESNDYDSARNLQAQLNLLMTLRLRMPPKKFLQKQLKALAQQMRHAEDHEMVDVAEVLHAHYSSTSSQLRLEKRACQAYQQNIGHPICLCQDFAEIDQCEFLYHQSPDGISWSTPYGA